MPGIWNVSNNYNVNNNKRVSSKLTFEVGEKFTGKIVHKGEGKDVTVKLGDGWQFNAEIDGDIDLTNSGNVKFEVEGYENGKLKLKLVKDDMLPSKGDILNELPNKGGIDKTESMLLKAMIKFNIPLTKENINDIKGMIQFNEKLNIGEEEISKFIKSYLQGKGISMDSLKGKEIADMLKGFINEFKGMSEEEILFFKENNIDFNEGEIKSFNKLFKDGNITKLFDEIKGELEKNNITENNVADRNSKEVKVSSNTKGNEGIVLESNNISIDDDVVKQDKQLERGHEKQVEVGNSNQEKEVEGSNLSQKTNGYEVKEKISMLEILKQAMKPEGVNQENKVVSNISELPNLEGKDNILNTIKSIGNGELVNNLKELLNTNTFTKESVQEVLSKVLGSNIDISDNEFNAIKNFINEGETEEVKVTNNNVFKDISVEEVVVDGLDEKSIKDEIKQSINKVNESLHNIAKDEVKASIKENIEELKSTIKDMIAQSKIQGEAGEKIFNLIKNNLNSFKLLNTISNEYYYLDMPIKREEQEYPCKLIVKDNRKDGKKIDRNNVKMVISVQTINLGTIDGFLSFRESSLDVLIKCDRQVINGIESGKMKLEKSLKDLGFNVNINVTEKEEDITITNCRTFFGEEHKTMLDIKV
ncbi:MAG: hypothetical protein ACRC7N_00280 [Clostridium sp.]